MTVTPAGSISIAKEALRQTLAACPTWIAMCAAVDAEDPVNRIYLEGLPSPADLKEGYTVEEWQALWPCAWLWAKSFGLVQDAEPGYSATPYGSIGLTIWRPVEEFDTFDLEPTSEYNLDWSNIVGQIVDELSDRSGGQSTNGDAFLDFYSIECPDGFYVSKREEAAITGIFQGVDLTINFSSGRGR